MSSSTAICKISKDAKRRNRQDIVDGWTALYAPIRLVLKMIIMLYYMARLRSDCPESRGHAYVGASSSPVSLRPSFALRAECIEFPWSRSNKGSADRRLPLASNLERPQIPMPFFKTLCSSVKSNKKDRR